MTLKLKKPFLKAILGILILLICVVGFSLIAKHKVSSIPATSSEKKVSAITPFPSDIPTILGNYPLNASEGARNKYRDQIEKVGKKTTALSVSNCKLNPAIIVISRTDQLKITNKDKNDRDLRLGVDYTITIPASSEQTTSLDFTPGTGIFSIYCGTNHDPIGILFVTP